MDTKTIHITRTFDAPLARVWQAFTDPEMITKWWGPKDFSAPHIQIDFRVGGKYLFCMRGAMGAGMPEQDFWSGGIYEEIIPMQKIVCSDRFADKDGNWVNGKDIGMPGEWPDEMRVTFTFTEENGKTILTLVHEGHPSEMAGDANTGWNQSLDKLVAAL